MSTSLRLAHPLPSLLLAALLAFAAAPALAGGPPPRRPQRPPRVRIERVPLPPAGPAACLERAILVNEDRAHAVLVQVHEVQHLFSGPLEQSYLVQLDPGERWAFRCTYWPGAMTRTDLRIVGVAILPPVPFGREPATPPTPRM